METEHDYPMTIGDRNLIQVTVSHDLGDRTIVVVAVLATIIGACGVVMGLNLSKQSRLDAQAAILEARIQVQNNQNSRIEAQLQEIRNERR